MRVGIMGYLIRPKERKGKSCYALPLGILRRSLSFPFPFWALPLLPSSLSGPCP